MRIDARLVHKPFDPAAELTAFSAEGAGAIASFTGLCRPTGKDGEPDRSACSSIIIRGSPNVALATSPRPPNASASSAVRIVHRCGAIAPGEAIVFVAAAAGHRRAAFEAVDYLMDRLKTDALFWKREDGVDGSRWIEPTEADRADRARWSA